MSSIEINPPTAYSQELKDAAEAALVLCSWRHLKLGQKSAFSLYKSIKQDRVRRNKRRMGPPPELPPPVQELPTVPALASVIGRCTVKPLVKELSYTDVDDDQQRLCLSSREFVVNFMLPLLNEKEMKNLEGDGIPVITYDGDGNGYELHFKLWGKRMYVLTRSNWKKFCHDHNFVNRKHQVINRKRKKITEKPNVKSLKLVIGMGDGLRCLR